MTGWLADLVYHDGCFQSGLAMFAGPDGCIVRFSNDPADLAQAQRLPGRAILPGLVNVHSHTFQRVIRGRTEHRSAATSDTFWTWREAMYHAANLLTPEDIFDVARMAFLEMLLSGITTVGEFHYLHHAPDGTPYPNRNLLAYQILRAARETGLRIALLRTAYARSGWNKPPNPGQRRFLTQTADQFIADTEALRLALQTEAGSAWIGVAPHSIRALPIDYLRQVCEYAYRHNLPVHMHVAEQPAEIDECLAEHALRPLELLERNGLLQPYFTGIHAIHITPEEASYLGAAKARVCACPTSERNLGDGPVPADRLYESGVGICFGSDSNIQIDVLEDARQLEYHLRMRDLRRVILSASNAPDGLAQQLFAGATQVGAASLGAPGGTLEPGRTADFFTVDLNDPSIAGASASALLSSIVFSLARTAVRDVFVNGRAVIQNGHYPLTEEITQRFVSVQQRLWGAS